MEKGKTYRTVRAQATAEYIERRSRFLAHVCPVDNEPDALAFLEEIRRIHHDATHNVYAYVLSDNHIERFSDDGEPSGTAGIPVLDVIKKEGLCDLIVVVTRYFGGVLLGAGGLVRAYSKAAHDGIAAAEPVTLGYCYALTLTCPYDLYGKLRYYIQTEGFITGDTDFGTDVTATVFVPYDRLEAFQKGITERTGGAVTPQITGERYIPVA